MLFLSCGQCSLINNSSRSNVKKRIYKTEIKQFSFYRKGFFCLTIEFAGKQGFVFAHLHLSFSLLSHIKTIHDTVGSTLLTLCILKILAQVVFTEANHSVSVFV